MSSAFGVYQLDIYFDLIASPPHAAFEDIANAELAADLLCVDGLTLLGKRRVVRDHEASRDPGEIGGQIIGDPIGEILLLLIV